MKNSSARSRDDGPAARRVLTRPIARVSEWFMDEVAIDFPSLGEAAGRMRDAFLAPLHEGADGDDRPSLSAELSLTPHEAFHGTTLPLEVPIRKLCADCGGRGETWSEPCGRCLGTGQQLARHLVKLIVPPRVRDGARFCLSVSAPSASPTRIAVRIAIR